MRWRYLDSEDVEVGSSDDFDTQAEAESWLGDEWRALLDRGIETVELVDDLELIYRMSLQEDLG